MWKVYLSRWVNYRLFGGKPNQMLSSRAYVEHMVRAERIINGIFFWQDNHCRKTFLWEMRYNRKQLQPKKEETDEWSIETA